MRGLRDTFGERFASSAFQYMDDDAALVGKFGRILDFGTHFDCWFVGAELEPLSGYRLNRMQETCEAFGYEFHRLTGEAYAIGVGAEFVMNMAPLLKIRRKRVYSPETLAKQRERMEAVRSAVTDSVGPSTVHVLA